MTSKRKQSRPIIAGSIEEKYPRLAAWIQDGWIELGPTD
jgi:hypothetical protein